MSHYKVGDTRAEATPREWLGVGRQIGELANEWAGRNDMVAYVGPPSANSPETGLNHR